MKLTDIGGIMSLPLGAIGPLLCPHNDSSTAVISDYRLFYHVQCNRTAESPCHLIVDLKCCVFREPLRAPAAK